MLEKFNDFVENYDLEDPNINRKVIHSKNVRKLMLEFAKKLNWNEEEQLIAEQIGLLHDIGRFQEWKEQKSYVGLNFDHGEYGVKLLQENQFYLDFNISEENKKIIFNSIFFHNKFNVPEANNDKFIKLIRDVDKIDNLMKLSANQTFYDYISKIFQGNHVSPKIKEDFNNEKSINTKDVNSLTDYYLMILAFIFDINYDISIHYIKENGAIQNFAILLKEKDIYYKYLELVNNYIERRLENVR